jgi:methylthioribose-1-phosphate isomerase
VETIQWTDDGVVMIDQTKLPREQVFVTCKTYEEVAEAIRSMVNSRSSGDRCGGGHGCRDRRA